MNELLPLACICEIYKRTQDMMAFVKNTNIREHVELQVNTRERSGIEKSQRKRRKPERDWNWQISCTKQLFPPGSVVVTRSHRKDFFFHPHLVSLT